MHDDASPRARAIGALAEIFLGIAVSADDPGSFERDALHIGRDRMASAIGLALEALDARLPAQRPKRLKVHDVRDRAPAAETGDASFSAGRHRGEHGRDAHPLAGVLDVPHDTHLLRGRSTPRQARAQGAGLLRAAGHARRFGGTIRREGIPSSASGGYAEDGPRKGSCPP